jgi:hypothetical protein
MSGRICSLQSLETCNMHVIHGGHSNAVAHRDRPGLVQLRRSLDVIADCCGYRPHIADLTTWPDVEGHRCTCWCA